MSERIPPQQMVPVTGAHSVIIVPTTEQKNAYLERIAHGRSLHGAAADLDLPYMSFVRERRADDAFENDVKLALAVRGGAMLEIALEQCTVGVDKVLTHQGHVSYEYPNGYELDDEGNAKPGTVRKPVTVKELVTTNSLLLALLKAIYPEQFKDRSEVSVNTIPTANATNDAEAQALLTYLEDRALARRKVRDPDEDLL